MKKWGRSQNRPQVRRAFQLGLETSRYGVAAADGEAIGVVAADGEAIGVVAADGEAIGVVAADGEVIAVGDSTAAALVATTVGVVAAVVAPDAAVGVALDEITARPIVSKTGP